jgi:hypothetical protein
VSHSPDVDDTLLIEEILTIVSEKVEKCHLTRKNSQGNETVDAAIYCPNGKSDELFE